MTLVLSIALSKMAESCKTVVSKVDCIRQSTGIWKNTMTSVYFYKKKENLSVTNI